MTKSFGGFSSNMASFELMTFSLSKFRFGNALGLAPVAIIILSAFTVETLSLLFISMLFLDLKRPMPLRCFILFFFIRNSMPLLRR